MQEIQAQTQISFTYDFIKQGSKVVIDKDENKFHVDKDGTIVSYDRNSTVILDVGNCLDRGVIDVHQLENGFQWKKEQIVSTTKLVSYFPSLLDQIDREANHITIIVHTFPDFDCFASAYITSYYLTNGQFPPHTRELVDYAEKIDSGRLTLNPEHVFTPYSITLVLGETVGLKDQHAYLNKGLEVIDYVLKRLPELGESEQAIDSPVLFEDNHPFKREQQVIEADYQKYRYDLATICEKRAMRLPSLSGTTIEVDGLFWEQQPSSSLDRLWARTDSTSPSGKGYVFTFVPRAIAPPPQVIQKFEDPAIQGVLSNSNRAVISVDGNSDVTLVNLGRLLELEEQKKENRILGTKKGSWRSREQRRFQDDWIDNGDPWYDGRNNQYQIVDGPRVGSLLSLEEIKQIVLDYTKPKVKENHTKILYPFQFRTMDFPKLYHTLVKNGHFHQINQMADKRTTDYFRPYIREYLFNSGDDESKYSYTFENNSPFYLKMKLENQNIVSGQIVEEPNDVTGDELILEAGKTSISLFRYGVGFIIIDTNIISKQKDNLLFDLLLEINKELCEGEHGKSILLQYMDEYLLDLVPFLHDEKENGLMYSQVMLDQSSYFESAKKEMLYKLCSQTGWNFHFESDSKHMADTIERMYYDKNDSMILGFSKKGSVLLTFEKDVSQLSSEQQEEYEQELKEEKRIYETWDFYIYLLVLHQRYALMNFSKELTEIGIKSNVKKVSKLRDILFEFIMQGWFSQITDDESGLDIHKKWMNVLETQTLHDEVLQQVSTIADYQGSKSEKDFNLRFTLISFVFLIITGISGFFGMNIPIITSFSNLEAIEFSIYSTLGIIVLWVLVYLVGQFRK